MSATLRNFACAIKRHPEAAGKPPADAGIVFVWGDDRDHSLQNIHQIRTSDHRAFIIVVTGFPDCVRWLDGLEAGANDYCCMPMDSRHVSWLLRPDAHLRVHAAEAPGRRPADEVTS